MLRVVVRTDGRAIYAPRQTNAKQADEPTLPTPSARDCQSPARVLRLVHAASAARTNRDCSSWIDGEWADTCSWLFLRTSTVPSLRRGSSELVTDSGTAGCPADSSSNDPFLVLSAQRAPVMDRRRPTPVFQPRPVTISHAWRPSERVRPAPARTPSRVRPSR